MKSPITGKAMFFALGAATLLLWTTPAGAEASTMRMEIPFAFVAGDQVLPAGRYIVTVNPEFRRCRFDNLSVPAVQMVRLELATDRRRMSKVEPGTLRFTRYGGQHFLSNVWQPGQEEGNRIAPSKRLLEAAKSRGGNGGKTTVVTVVGLN